MGITSDWDTDPNATRVESGTSMATPHVSGVVADYLSRNPGATPAQVAAAVVGGSDDRARDEPGNRFAESVAEHERSNRRRVRRP